MKFRFHRGGFDESMATTVEVNSIEDIADLIGFPHEITFQHCGIDSRNGWDTYYVIANDCVIGMSDGIIVSHKNPPTNQ